MTNTDRVYQMFLDAPDHIVLVADLAEACGKSGVTMMVHRVRAAKGVKIEAVRNGRKASAYMMAVAPDAIAPEG